MLLFLVDVVLVLAFALFVSSVLLRQTSSKKIYLIAVFLIGYATIVLTAEILGLVYQLANPLAWLLVHLALLGVGAFVWRRAESPHPLGPWEGLRWKRALNPLSYFRRDPDLQLLLLGVCVVYIWGAILIVIIPPNNWDSMTYHLSKVGFWLQNSTLFPWVTYNPRQTMFPINAEIGHLWSLVFMSSDRLVAFPQWVSALVTMTAIVGLAQHIGFKRKAAIFAALIWAGFPLILLESTTTQNDLVLAGFFLSGLYLFYEGWQRSNRTVLILSGLAVGLAFGTKSTVFFLLPGLAIVALLLAVSQRKFDLLIIWGVACAVAVLLFGAYIYILNFGAYHNFLGEPVLVSEHVRSEVSRFELLQVNTFRYLYQMVDFMLPEAVYMPIGQAKAAIGSTLADCLNIPVLGQQTASQNPFFLEQPSCFHEDCAWFGPLGFLLLLPAMGYALYSALRKRDSYRLGLVIIPVCFLLLHSVAQHWTPFKSRYYVSFAAVAAPLMAIIIRPGSFVKLLRMLFVVSALSIMLITSLGNPLKPIYRDGESIFNKSQMEIRGLASDDIPAYLALITQISTDEPVGVMLTDKNYTWDYPLFLPGFTRTVIPIVYDSTIDSLETLAAHTSIDMLIPEQEQVLTDHPLNYLLVSNIYIDTLDTSGFTASSDDHLFTLFVRDNIPK